MATSKSILYTIEWHTATKKNTSTLYVVGQVWESEANNDKH